MQHTVSRMVDASHLEEASLQIDAYLALSDVTADLATALEPLAPFGSGNPKLILAFRGLTLSKNVRVGRNQEHARWTVADDTGITRSVLWWDGGEESPPEGLFDLACTVHATNWQGEYQVQMELVDFHEVDGKNIEVSSRKIELVDYRQEHDKVQLLSTLPANTLIWAEAEEKDQFDRRFYEDRELPRQPGLHGRSGRSCPRYRRQGTAGSGREQTHATSHQGLLLCPRRRG